MAVGPDDPAEARLAGRILGPGGLGGLGRPLGVRRRQRAQGGLDPVGGEGAALGVEPLAPLFAVQGPIRPKGSGL